MNENDLSTVKSMNSAAIIAPAGHGKTEMITELVSSIEGKHLLLTHTNAGVDALQKRLKKKGISKDRYLVNTIAGFCMKWCDAYPGICGIDKNILMSDKRFYPMYYSGACALFEHEWACNVLTATYATIIVDEYQDCVVEQHSIFLAINKYLPVYVLGDPLQAIFGWAGTLVSWDDITFPILQFDTVPWRWKHSNMELGNYLSEIRDELLPALHGNTITIQTENVGNSVSVVPCAKRLDSRFLRSLQTYKTVLFITKWPREQKEVCLSTGGLFQNDEPQALEELYDFARYMDSGDGIVIANAIYRFMQLCATHINDELEAYGKRLAKGNTDFHLIRKHTEFGRRISKVIQSKHKQDVIHVLNYFKDQAEFRIYRKELYYEAIRALNYSVAHNILVEEAAQQIRLLPGQIKKYSDFQFLSSRTVLSKGLEYECVVIDLSQYQKKPYKSGQYIPFCTRMVFLKYYTPSAENQLHFWGQADRRAYVDAINEVLKDYLAEPITLEKEDE